jgi:hypothetical protein
MMGKSERQANDGEEERETAGRMMGKSERHT